MRGLLLLSLFLMAGLCRSSHDHMDLVWNKEEAQKDLDAFTQSPHPMGSPRIAQLGDYIEQEMQSSGLKTGRESFTANVPDPDLLGQPSSPMRSPTLPIKMQNVYARYQSGGDSCAFLISSHYDSKRLEDGSGIGANDSGSSSIALLQIMRGLSERKPQLRCDVVAVWFDGEEAYLKEWRDGETRHPAKSIDNTYGSRHLADSLTKCGPAWCLPEAWSGASVKGLMLLDMVGMPNLRLTQETNSTRELLQLAMGIDQDMFKGQLFANSSPKPIEDDHLAFLDKGIPALDLIGFEDLATWHQSTDTRENISMDSIEKSSRLAHSVLLKLLQP